MKRLVIQQEGRTIRHELGEAPVSIGRDPGCDLFFADRRLSREHARFEPTEKGVRVRDLDSRNGSWIDKKRVREAELEPGDSVRMGGLIVTYEEDRPPAPPPPSANDTATVMLSREDVAGGAESEADAATVLLSRSEPEAPESDKTVRLERGDVAPPDSGKTQILRAEPPDAPPTVDTKTRILSREALGPPPPVEPAEPPEDVEAEHEGGFASSLSWSARFLLVTSALALVVYFTLAFPLMRTLGNALREESLRRGRALLEVLAASNGTIVGEGRLRDLSVEHVLREERVKEALLLDLEGNVLAPSSRSDERIDSVEGISASIADIRTFYLGRRGGDYVMVQPLLHESRRVGLAVLVYEVATASGSWALAVLFLGFVVLLLGVATSLVVGKRMTLEPIGSLVDDIEAVVKKDAETVPARQGFAELSQVARSINRLIARTAGPEPRAQAPIEAPPEPDPAAPPPRRSKPAPEPEAAAPVGSRAKPEPVPASGAASGEASRVWVDESFIVVRAEEEAAGLVGTTVSAIEGKHLIEAVADQKLLEAVLDAINALENDPSSTSRCETGSGAIEVKAAREEGSVVVSLCKL